MEVKEGIPVLTDTVAGISSTAKSSETVVAFMAPDISETVLPLNFKPGTPNPKTLNRKIQTRNLHPEPWNPKS